MLLLAWASPLRADETEVARLARRLGVGSRAECAKVIATLGEIVTPSDRGALSAAWREAVGAAPGVRRAWEALAWARPDVFSWLVEEGARSEVPSAELIELVESLLIRHLAGTAETPQQPLPLVFPAREGRWAEDGDLRDLVRDLRHLAGPRRPLLLDPRASGPLVVSSVFRARSPDRPDVLLVDAARRLGLAIHLGTGVVWVTDAKASAPTRADLARVIAFALSRPATRSGAVEALVALGLPGWQEALERLVAAKDERSWQPSARALIRGGCRRLHSVPSAPLVAALLELPLDVPRDERYLTRFLVRRLMPFATDVFRDEAWRAVWSASNDPVASDRSLRVRAWFGDTQARAALEHWMLHGTIDQAVFAWRSLARAGVVPTEAAVASALARDATDARLLEMFLEWLEAKHGMPIDAAIIAKWRRRVELGGAGEAPSRELGLRSQARADVERALADLVSQADFEVILPGALERMILSFERGESRGVPLSATAGVLVEALRAPPETGATTLQRMRRMRIARGLGGLRTRRGLERFSGTLFLPAARLLDRDPYEGGLF